MSAPPQPPGKPSANQSEAKPAPRLKSIKPITPGDANKIAPSIPSVKTKKEFKPNIPTARKKKDDKDPLSGAITDLISASLSPLNVGDRPAKPNASSMGKFRPNLNPNRKKPAAIPITNLFHTPLVQADTQPQSTYEMNKKSEKKDSDLLAQLFHEMEVDPMQPFHPTHLPLVDPRKIMKAYSLDDASKDLNETKKELEEKIKNGELSDTTNFNLQAIGSEDNNGGQVKFVESSKKKNKEVSTKDKPFYVEDQFLNKDKLFFIQLPNSLPSTQSRPNFNIPNPVLPPPKPTTITKTVTNPDGSITTTTIPINGDTKLEEQPKVELDEKAFVPMIYPGDFPPSLKEMPSGKLGTLKIYKSGKTILKIGAVEYDISSGDKLKFLEEVKCFQTKGGPENSPTCYTLGIPSQHLVAAPIISQISGI
ncbi:hypothetical protein RB653_003249 [Dictyostelium firmibasis]|uniref:Uncharacterized protein n=1 Tax=Dictyostelium firmibasis TaxID=79012 RepID=A0AAN7TYZ0_9MYCE